MPIGKILGALLVTLVTLQLSDFVGVPNIIPIPEQLVIDPGAVIFGFSVSITLTVKAQELLLPEGSVAVNVTLLVPTAKKEPLIEPAV